MSDSNKIRLVQALVGAIVLTLLMQPVGILGFGPYIWLLFLPLLLFFALGADFKKIPSMFVCYVCGVLWAMFNGVIQGAFEKFAPALVVGIVPTIIVIFLVLTIHENFLSKTILGNIPAMFLGMSTTFFTFMPNVEITPFHLIGFYAYGLFLSVVLVASGMAVCSAIFGKDRAFKAITGKSPEQTKTTETLNSKDIKQVS